MTNNELYLAILVMALANLLTRAVPFLFFRKKSPPAYIIFIEKSFPPIIMTILVFYTLGSIDFSNAPYGLKEFLAVFITAILHIKYSNYLVSIFMGTISYMFMVQYFV